MRRLSRYVLPLALLLPLVLAPAAQAYNDGRGFYGATNDKVVTDAGFILIIFFPVFVFLDEHAPAGAGEAQAGAQSGTQGPGRSPVARRLVGLSALSAAAAGLR